jgi:hypothetical protein
VEDRESAYFHGGEILSLKKIRTVEHRIWILPHPSYLPRKLGIPATLINGGDGKVAESALPVEAVISFYFVMIK